jgi:hypothetical protein
MAMVDGEQAHTLGDAHLQLAVLLVGIILAQAMTCIPWSWTGMF